MTGPMTPTPGSVVSDRQMVMWDELPPSQPVTTAPAPFFKWVGGKRHLLGDITCRLPDRSSGNYWELFLGSGALFFAAGRFFDTAVLSDINPELIGTFMAVRDDPGGVLELLGVHAREHSRAHYHKMRNAEGLSGVETAARFLYLNKTCYNGLYRVNSAGKFNVAYSDQVYSEICNGPAVRAASEALRETHTALAAEDFEHAAPGDGDVVYCDPPYHGGYDKYAPGGFSDEDHERLAAAVRRWADTGAFVVVSNYDTPLVRDLYKGFYFTLVSSPRTVNADIRGRGATPELIITTYEHPMWHTDKWKQLALL